LQYRVPTEVVEYLLKRIERSFAAAQDAIFKINEEALATHSPITINFVKKISPKFSFF